MNVLHICRNELNKEEKEKKRSDTGDLGLAWM